MSSLHYICDKNNEEKPEDPVKNDVPRKGDIMNNIVIGTEQESSVEAPQQPAARCYSTYKNNNNLAFDPMTELNLPSSYEEVLSRFNNLQGERSMEELN